MYWCGSWFLSQVLDSDIKDDIDVAPVPSINGKQATVIHGLGNCIYKDTKNPKQHGNGLSFYQVKRQINFLLKWELQFQPMKELLIFG